jgi:hypothetical protein
MALNAAQKLIIGRNLGLAESMFQYMLETSQGPKANTIKGWRESHGGATNAVKANGGTDTVLIAAVAEGFSTFAAS